jgi:hypothetical protein
MITLICDNEIIIIIIIIIIIPRTRLSSHVKK